MTQEKPSGQLARPKAADFTVIVAAAMGGLLLVLANPGFFSHDEFDRRDNVAELGFLGYLQGYVFTLPAEGPVSIPYRPIAFLAQGLLGLVMDDYPVLVHLFAFLSHLLVVLLVYLLVLQLGGNRKLGLFAAILFSLNPGVIVAVSWSAALMDRMFTFFTLLALFFINRYLLGGLGRKNLVFASLLTALGLLSKETAVAIPLLLFLYVLWSPEIARAKRFWETALSITLPVGIWIFVRVYQSNGITSAIPDSGPYGVGLSNIWNNVVAYFAYPFLPTLAEVQNIVFLGALEVIAAGVVHMALIFSIYLRNGVRMTLMYIVGYFVFLAPILILEMQSTQYLYASSLFLSVGVASLFVDRAGLGKTAKAFGFFLVVLLLIHSGRVQLTMYDTGMCMERAKTSLVALTSELEGPGVVTVAAEDGSPEWVLARFSSGRTLPVHNGIVQLKFDGDADFEGSEPTYLMSRDCIFRAK